MFRIKTLVFASFAALLGLAVGSPARATGEDPPLPTPCVDVEKTCQDAGSPTDPIAYDVTLANCGEVVLYCRVKDVLLDQIILDAALAPGESAETSGSYYPDACGESTNQVAAKCGYQLSQDVFGNVFDEAEATCRVPCDGESGCTLTPGYWKTHSIYGPAPYDATWAMIGEDTPFFLSGMSFYNVLWTEPSGGNAYYILAHAYIAARLNVLNGASVPADVAAVLGEATDLFGLHTPAFIGGLRGRDSLRKAFVAMAEILDDYNNGVSGPGHCDDEGGGDHCE